MEPLVFLRSKIADFPGYLDENGRGRSDELVRSYLGEALAELEARLAPVSDAVATRIGDLLFRVGFVNQTLYRRYETAANDGVPMDAVVADDAAIVEVADRAAAVSAQTLPAYLDDIAAVLDRRDHTMASAHP